LHYAAFQFADMAKLDAALASDGFKMLVADFDAAWPHGVSRTRDRLEMVEEIGGNFSSPRGRGEVASEASG
jgi:hypothetical protein